MGSSRARSLMRLAITMTVIAVAFVGAFLVRFDLAIPAERQFQVLVLVGLVVLVKVAIMRLTGVGRQSWQYTSLHDVIEITKYLAMVALLMLVARLVVGAGAPTQLPFGVLGLPIGVIAADFVLSVYGLVGVRVARRLQSERTEARRFGGNHELKRVLLVGAGRAGVMTANDLKRRPEVGLDPIGFVDDDPLKIGRSIAGLKVLGTSADLEALTRDEHVDQAVISIAAANRQDMRRIVDACAAAKLPTKIVPGLYEIVSGGVSISRIRDVDVADLLGRDPIVLDDEATGALLTGRCVMVTGAGGSIGSELVRQVARMRPARIVLVEQAEPALWAIDRELLATHPELDTMPIMADVCDRPRMERVFTRLKPEVVIHAAAHKHVPMMERNPGEAAKNNVGGTQVMADLAARCGVLRFVLVSTDKAVNPTSIMGATKRLAERYVQHVAATTGLHAMSVRFGNVLGSVGSVVPVFKQQVAAGGPVTVTHPDMCRYFMTIPEASQLVLQAATIGQPGEILVLDMGEPVRIVDLAEAVIRLSGFEPDTDIPIEFTGLRAGEKMFEELSLSAEHAARTRHPKIWIGHNSDPRWTSANSDVARLLTDCDTMPADQVRAQIRSLVPEFVNPPSVRQPVSADTRSATNGNGSPSVSTNGIPATNPNGNGQTSTVRRSPVAAFARARRRVGIHGHARASTESSR